MGLFTFILDYKGGTYLSQVEADDVARARARWLEALDLDAVAGLTRRSRDHVRARFMEETMVPVSGLVGVWCTDAMVRGKLAIVHIVGIAPAPRTLSPSRMRRRTTTQ